MDGRSGANAHRSSRGNILGEVYAQGGTIRHGTHGGRLPPVRRSQGKGLILSHRHTSSKCRTTSGTRCSSFSKIALVREPRHAARGNSGNRPNTAFLSSRSHHHEPAGTGHTSVRLEPSSVSFCANPSPGRTGFSCRSSETPASQDRPANRRVHPATPGRDNAPDPP